MPQVGRSFSGRFRWPTAPAQVIVGEAVFFLALIYLKAVVGCPDGLQCLRWESGFILGEASFKGKFFAPLQGGCFGLRRFNSSALIFSNRSNLRRPG